MSAGTKRRPIGRLASGEPYYALIGQMRYDGDRVQCHLCGRWFKMVGGNHTISAHDMTVAEYRELFRLNGNVSTVAPETAERKRETMLAQIASGERDQSVLGQPVAADRPEMALAHGAPPPTDGGVAPNPQPRPRPLQRRSVFAFEDLVALPGVRTRVASHAP